MVEIGKIKKLYRYPVKSMAGEELASTELGWHGINGDRRYSFIRTGNMTAFPFPCLTASKMPELIRYKAYHSNENNPSKPSVRVRTPEGEDFEVEHESLRKQIATSYGAEVSLIRINNGIFDDSPISLISTTTLRTLETETRYTLDVRRFRPNLFIESSDDTPFPEDEWVGKTILFGNQPNAPSLRVTIRDIRCVVVNLDPETAESAPHIFKTIVHSRENCAGVYASVLNPGVLSVGDKIYFEG